MSLDAFLRLGETITLGTHRFTADEIKTFARAFDPQPFHVDEEEARRSVFGALCASGWHTCAMWMRYNLKGLARLGPGPWDGPGEAPEFGPSPGFSDLKWPKPVYAGDAITFYRAVVSHRPLASRPGWHLVTLHAAAENQDGQPVLSMVNGVLLRT
ncbi:MaoC family dehydratase [Nitratireductor pacificus]|uniref:MaoC-like dehydratase n=1 Tax=Nitratireductor pacificus pht-3B TaxID=391937 RepID=K2MZ23_9HYPH|nr:MaoC family dehydratase [Nitratireductor pacificus]EKF17233.1 MaoC-like dehydratase [Nitratireductor pacificus pht-3B]